MSQSLLLTMQGWQAGGGTAYSYNNDSGLWSTLASDPQFVSGVNSSFSAKGGWDGNRWYVISPTGGLHAYTPTTDSWTTTLAGSGSILTGTPTSIHWCMCSDGSYVYILSSSNDFRRYNPGNDSLAVLATPAGAAYSVGMFLVYDGSGSIYGSTGLGTSAKVQKYDIATNTWTDTGTGGWSGLGSSTLMIAEVLQGSLWLLTYNAGSMVAYQYSPASGAWATKASHTGAGITGVSPGGADSDSTIRWWPGSAGVASIIYNVATDTWSTGANSPYSWSQGSNWAVTRAFSAAFTWYQADGTTLLDTTVDLGVAVLGQSITFHAKVKTPVARAAGVTVSVPDNTSTDAEDPVRICQTSNGTFATSFSTGALNAGDFFDVYIQFSPTASQTLGLLKRFALQIS